MRCSKRASKITTALIDLNKRPAENSRPFIFWYSEEMKLSLAQHVFYIIRDHGVDEDALGLLSHLSTAGLINKDEVVKLDKYNKSAGSAKLSDALLSLAKPDHYMVKFFYPEAAHVLMALDPEFFNKRSPDDKASWVEHTLIGWSKSAEADRHGFKAGPGGEADQWLCTILPTLSDDTLTSVELWLAVLKLDLAESAEILVKHRPNGWAHQQSSGKPDIAKASMGWAWDRALESGVDAHAKSSKGVPFWRACLPSSSVLDAPDGSLRERIEEWAKEEKKKNLHGFKEEFGAYVKACCLAKINNYSGPNAWGKKSMKQKIEVLNQMPNTWVNEDVNGGLGWLFVMSFKEDMKEWVQKLSANSGWMSEINKNPLSLLALNVILHHHKLPLTSSKDQISVSAAQNDPYYKWVWDRVEKAADRKNNEIASFLESCAIGENTPLAKGKKRAGPRL